MAELVAYALTAAVLTAASITDLRTREVPDWLNYGAAVSGVAIALISSLILGTVWPFVYSLTGLLVFLAVGSIMFYAGQWGGGDSKMLIALGALLGLQFSFKFPFLSLSQIMISFWMNLMLAGVLYAFAWSIVIAARNRQRFAKQFAQQAAQLKGFRLSIVALLAVAIVLILFVQGPMIRMALVAAVLATVAAVLLWLFAKSVEKSCMLKYIEPEKLTEGDWIAKDVYVNRKYVCGPKDLGIEKSQIRQLLKYRQLGKIRKVLIKEGIPFVPSFLIAFLVSVKFGNLLLLLI